jgi:hypothetical protein
MLGTISYFKDFGRGRGWGFIESKGKNYHFKTVDVASGWARVRVGVEVEFSEIPSLNPHVTPRAHSVLVLPLRADDAEVS